MLYSKEVVVVVVDHEGVLRCTGGSMEVLAGDCVNVEIAVIDQEGWDCEWLFWQCGR